MEKIYIIIVEDQREVLQAISKDLAVLEDAFLLEECESALEAVAVAEDIDRNGDFVALVITDQVMPNKTGVQFLVDMHLDERFKGTRKVLLTGLATHKDTIEAINKASINHYIAKPWKADELLGTAKALITEYILEKGVAYEPFLEFLDKPLLLEKLRRTT